MSALDLTQSCHTAAWDDLDFADSYLFFDAVTHLPGDLSFQMWGIRLHKANTYIAGYATVSLMHVTHGTFQVSLYQGDGTNLLKDRHGNPVVLIRTWNAAPVLPAAMYEFEGVLAWPLGYCNLTLYATGPVTLTYDEATCMPFEEYQCAPHNYALPK